MTTVSSLGVMLTRTDGDGLARSLDMLAAAGAEHVEINPTLVHGLLNGRVRPEVVRTLRDDLTARSLGAVVHAPLSLSLMDEEHAGLQRAVGEASVAFAAGLGARRMVIHPGWVEGRRLKLERERLMQMERAGLRHLATVAADSGVTLCLENMPATEESPDGTLDNHGLDCRSVAAQVRAVDHPGLAATIDVSHAYISSAWLGEDLRAQLEALAPVTRHLHWHDSFGRVATLPRPRPGENLAYGLGDLHLPLGWGDLPWEAAMAGLPLPDEVSITLEITPKYATPDTVTDSVARARALIERLGARQNGEAAA
ncbi:sugar phosphate isomerase/epimerase family protein [Roseospira navarrensis]|uniref:TIM barrel protein n=1 Tax=Roseospira navarrensis TaxID=140058 RepID=A0A7X1ZE55_9PROT|nr:sugar phosphate isomerase/epimerase [Roseospira navarrensis]MQX36884.1 TIM barrel protein [Roseospira navarrensis]